MPSRLTTEKTMKKPRTRLEPEVRKSQILEAAFLEFSENGYDQTSIADIANRSNVAKRLPLFYFDSKSNLFREVVKRRISKYTSSIVSLIESVDGDWSTKFQMVSSYILKTTSVNSEGSAIFFLVASECHKFPELVEIYFREGISPLIREIESVLEAGAARGTVRTQSPETTAIAILSGGLLASIWQRLFQHIHTIDMGEFSRTYIDLVLKGILVRCEPTDQSGNNSFPFST